MTMDKTIGTIGDFIDIVSDAKDRTVTSLTEYTKKTLISSRAYIEESLTREDGINSILKYVNQLFSGLVFTAIGLNNLAAGGRTVRDMAAMVSTEDFHEFVDLVKAEFGEKNVKISAALEDNNGGDEEDKSKKKLPEGATASIKETKPNDALFTGRLVEVQIADGKGHNIPFYFYVQIAPFTTPTSVMEQFIVSNYPPERSSRWAKFKAGEIKFWRDFVFEVDLINKRKKALKADKDGILREVEDRKQMQIRNVFKNFINNNHNSASSMIVVSRRTIDRIMKDEGLDYRRFDVRQKIMNGCMAMIMVVFDPNYSTVDIYMNGISNAGNYSLDQIKDSVGKGNKDAVDLKTLMNVLSSGNAPRF